LTSTYICNVNNIIPSLSLSMR